VSEKTVLESRFKRWTTLGAIILASASAVFLVLLFFSFRQQLRKVGHGIEAYSRSEGTALARLVLYDLAADVHIKRLGLYEKNLLERKAPSSQRARGPAVSAEVLEFVRANMDLPDTRIWLKANDSGMNTTVAIVSAAKAEIYRRAIREESTLVSEELEARVTFSDHLRGVILKSTGREATIEAGEPFELPDHHVKGQIVHTLSASRMIITLPLYVNNHRWGRVFLLMDRGGLAHAEAETSRIMTRGLLETGLLFIIILGAWGAFWAFALRAFRRDVIKPVILLAKRMDSLKEDSPPPRPETDELSWLSEAFDRLMNRLETQQEKLLDAERLGMMEKMGAGLSHELNNALNPAMLRLDELIMDGVPPDKKDMEAIRSYLVSARRVLKELTLLGPGRSTEIRNLAPAEWLQVARRLIEPQLRNKNIELRWESDLDQPIVLGEARSLTQVAVNLLINGIDAATYSEGTGRVRISLTSLEGGVSFEVEDNGPGLAEEIRTNLFEPFVTTKAKGTGLGLYMVKVLLRRMGASIEVRDGKSGGTVARVMLMSGPVEGEGQDGVK